MSESDNKHFAIVGEFGPEAIVPMSWLVKRKPLWRRIATKIASVIRAIVAVLA